MQECLRIFKIFFFALVIFLPQVIQTKAVEFQHLKDQDILGYDLLTPVEDASLKNISRYKCGETCAKHKKCKAFTYNEKSKWCFLKKSKGIVKPYKGAFSGIRINPSDFYELRKPNVHKTSVSEINRFGKPENNKSISCHFKRINGNLVGPKIKTHIEKLANKTYELGESIKINWSLASKDNSNCLTPLYLMFSMPKKVRFKGSGFIVVPPNIDGPFGIKKQSQSMRVFIPLSPKTTSKSGSFEIKIFQENNFEIRTSAIEIPKNNIFSRDKKDFNLEKLIFLELNKEQYFMSGKVSNHSVEIHDKFSLDVPTKVILSNSGEFRIHVFNNFYRVFDHRTGDLILERIGQDPNFSPTSRFLVSILKKYNEAEVIDLYSQEVEFTITPYNYALNSKIDVFAWGNNDMILVVGKLGYHTINVIQPYINRKFINKSLPLGDATANAFEYYYFDLNLDNLSLYIYGNNYANGSFSLQDIYTPITFNLSDNNYDTTPNDTRRRLITKIVFDWIDKGKQNWRWNLGKNYGLTNIISTKFTENIFNKEVMQKHWLARSPYLIKHRKFDKKDIFNLRNNKDDLLQSKIVKYRGNKTTNNSTFYNSRFKQVLKNYNIDLLKNNKKMFFTNTDKITENWIKELLHEVPSVKEYMIFPSNICLGWGLNTSKEDNRWNKGTHKEWTGWNFLDPLNTIWISKWKAPNNSIWMFQNHCLFGSGSYGGGQLSIVQSKFKNSKNLINFFGKQEIPIENNILGINLKEPIKAFLSQNRFLLVSGNDDTIHVINLNNNKTLHLLSNIELTDGIKELFLSEENELLLQLNYNGQFFIYSLKENIKILNGSYIDDEIIIYNDQGYYISTDEGQGFIKLKFPGIASYHDIHKFKTILNKPKVIRNILRNSKNKILPPQLPFPPKHNFNINFLSDKNNRILIQNKSHSITGLKELRLYRDGHLFKVEPLDGKEAEVEITVNIPNETHWITAVVVDKNNIESTPKTVELTKNKEQPNGNLYALAIGNNQYNHESLDRLNYATEDAKNFIKAVKVSEGVYYNSVIDLEPLLNITDLRKALTIKLKEIINAATDQDTITLFIAGHGLKDRKGKFYLADKDTDPDDLEGTAVSWDDIAVHFKDAKARVILFLDACHSGIVGKGATNDDVVDILLKDGKKSITVISASKGRQFSLEDSGLQGGVFTTFLVDILSKSKRAKYDLNKNGVIELVELYGALKRRVKTYTKGVQTPWIARNQMIGEVPLF